MYLWSIIMDLCLSPGKIHLMSVMSMQELLRTEHFLSMWEALHLFLCTENKFSVHMWTQWLLCGYSTKHQAKLWFYTICQNGGLFALEKLVFSEDEDRELILKYSAGICVYVCVDIYLVCMCRCVCVCQGWKGENAFMLCYMCAGQNTAVRS